MKRWLFPGLGYLTYSLVVLIFLLWWRFPADDIARWCEARLHARYPALVWKIAALHWKFPNRFVFEEIKGLSGKEAMLEIDSLTFTADVTSLLRKNQLITYSASLYEGKGAGRIHLTPGHTFLCQGQFAGVQLEQMHGLVARLQRAVRGELGTTFSWQGVWPHLATRDLSGMLTVENGLLPLRKPVLGLQEIPFSKLTASITYRDNEWQVDRGVLEAKSMHVSFKGNIVPGADLDKVKIHFTGNLTPRAELFKLAGIPNMAKVLRGFLRQGALPFTVSGTAVEPAVRLPEGLSDALRRFQPRGGRQ